MKQNSESTEEAGSLRTKETVPHSLTPSDSDECQAFI